MTRWKSELCSAKVVPYRSRQVAANERAGVQKTEELSCVSVSTYTSVDIPIYTYIFTVYVCVLAAETCGCPLLQALTRVLKVRLTLHKMNLFTTVCWINKHQ